MRESLAIGLAQWLPVPGATDANLATALDLVDRLAGEGAELVALPELWPCGYEPATLSADAAAAAEPLDGPRVTRLAKAAREAGVWLAAGSLPERGGDRVFNTAVLLSPDGELAGAHRKAHLYGKHEQAAFAAGDRLTTLEAGDLGTVGLCVCFDGDFPETARTMGERGARLVLCPCAYEVEATTWWDRLHPAAAMANGQWWVMPNQAGANAGVTFLGGSRVLSPFGDTVAAAPRTGAGEQLAPVTVVTTVSLTDEVARADAELAPLWRERRPAIYGTMGDDDAGTRRHGERGVG